MTAGLTIGIPVRNGAATLGRCLESVLAHAPAGTAIVVSDNCSSDETGTICRRFAARASGLHYTRQQSDIGPVANFRFVLEQARTEFFMWLADDDWLADDFPARATTFLEDNPAHVLATAVSVYHGEDGAVRFATIPSAVEQDDPSRRVEHWVEVLTDNSEFYGVYRRSALRFDPPNVMGSDWIAMMDTAFLGKIGVIQGAALHRRDRWDSPERFAGVAAAANLPAPQAEQPHLATALAALLRLALGESVYAALPTEQRLALALATFRQFRRNQHLPEEVDFWADGTRLFGEGPARRQGAALRRQLARACLEQLAGGPPVAAAVLELALALGLWRHPPAADEDVLSPADALLLEAHRDSLAAFACHALRLPAYKQPRFFSLDELPFALVDDYLGYVTAREHLFEADEDVEAFTAHLGRVVDSVLPRIPPDVPGLRIARLRAHALSACLERISLIPCYSSSRSLRPLMQARAQLGRLSLALRGVALDLPVDRPRNEEQPRRWLGVLGRGRPPRLKVGLLVMGLDSPTDTYMSLPAIAHLDRSRFEVVILVAAPAPDRQPLPIEEFAAALADRMVFLAGDHAEMVDAVRGEQLDFLLVGSNVTGSPTPAFYLTLCRLARWQIAFNPCCVTTGSPNVDYFVSASLLEERGAGEAEYVERLLQIDGPGHVRIVPPFEAHLTAGPSRPRPPGAGGVRLISGANYHKLSPRLRRTWLQLLARLPLATLELYPFGPAWSRRYDRRRLAELLDREARATGIERQRIRVLEPFATIDEMHRYLGEADIYLDSFPFSGINSVLDALSSGIPAVVRAGDSFRSNMGASALRELGLDEWVAAGDETYVAIVEALASDHGALQAAKKRVFDRMRRGTRLYDAQWFSGEFARILDSISSGG